MAAKSRKSTKAKKSSAKSSSQSNRIVSVVLVGVIGALVLIALVVYLTPLDDEELGLDVANANGVGTLPGDTTLSNSPPAYQPVSRASLALPTVAEEMDVAKLRSELTELAGELQRKYSDDPIALHIAAQIYSELQQTKSAEMTWLKCLAMNPGVAGPYAGMSQIYVASGRDEMAVSLLEQAISNQIVSAELLVALGNAHENQGQLDKAQEILSAAAEQFPENGAAYLSLGRTQVQLRDYAGAEQNLEKAIELEGESEAALFSLSTALVRQRKTEAATAVRDRLQAIRKQGTAGENEGFQGIYNSAFLEIAHRIMLAAASVAENHGDLIEAEKLVRRAIRLDPDRLKSYMSLSSIFRAKNDLPAALEVHKILLEKQPENPLNAINLASIAMQVGQTSLAEESLQDAVNRDRSNLMAKTALAKFRLAAGEFAACRDLAAEIVEQVPSAEAYFLLAAAYDGAGQAEAAKAAMTRAQQLDPNHPMLGEASTPDATQP